MQWVGDNSVPLDSRVSSVAETACFLFNTNSFHFSGGLRLETEINTLLPSQQIESLLQYLSQIRDSSKVWAAYCFLFIFLNAGNTYLMSGGFAIILTSRVCVKDSEDGKQGKHIILRI